MVRFSDMLGGDGEPKEPRAQTLPEPALADPIPEPEPEPEPEVAEPEPEAAVPEVAAPAAIETPQDVLERLTQYATSTRATEPVADPVADPEPTPTATPMPAPASTEIGPVGDDLLPRGKGANRKPGRREKRRP